MSTEETNATDRGSECNDLLGPAAWAVMAFGRVQKLVVRPDVADELACKWREQDPNADALPLYARTALDAARAAERERTASALRACAIAQQCIKAAYDEHQAGVQRVNDLLARMEKAKAEHDAAMADAARFRWIDEHALSVDMVADPDNLVQVWRDTLSGHPVTGRTLREAVDEAMRHNVEGNALARQGESR